MKGIVFTEFMDMVEQVFSFEVLDSVIMRSNLPNEGAYTAVGTYNHQEMVTMALHLSKEVNMSIPDLLEAFGKHLFNRFSHLYPNFFEGVDNAFDFLKNIDNYIHVEVRKLYPDAELPRFFHEQPDEHTMTMYYLSSRHFEDLACGLIKGCLMHFGVNGQVEKRETHYNGEEAIALTIRIN